MRFRSAVIAAICLFLVYLLVPTKTYYWDGVLFSLKAEQAHQGQLAVVDLFHPNHLIYTVFAWAVSIPGVRTIRVLQAINALAAAFCALFMYLFSRRVTGSEIGALSGMLLFAFGATWWKFSTDADAYILSVLFCLAALWFAERRFWLAIACHILAMLFHELAIFLYFPMLLAIRPLPRRAVYVVTTALAISAAYHAGYALSGHTGHSTIFSWITSYSADTPVTHTIRQITVGYLGSYLKLFAGGKMSLVRSFLGPLSILAFGACLILLIVCIRLLTTPTPSSPPALVPVLLAWFLPLAIFLACFDPASTFHKLFIWPPLVLLICAAARRRARSLAAFAAALACWNFGAFIWPHAHAAADPVLSLAETLQRNLPSNAVMYYSNFSTDDWYLRYFGPDVTWRLLPLPAHSNTPVCVETSALAVTPQLWSLAYQKWSLVTPQHDIRVACVVR